MRILSFIFVLCLLTVISYGQSEKENEKKIKPKRTDNYIRMRGLRFGADITRPFQDYWTKGNRYGSEFSADMELWPNLFPVFETGWEALKINSSYVDYSGSGSYSRMGFDYNMLEALTKSEKNIFYVGVRYGFAAARQQVNNYQLDSYWPASGSLGNQNFTAHWGEFMLGLKGEMFHNFYLGWTIRGKIKIAQKNLEVPSVYFIPGYGKADKNFVLDFTYSVYYNIPWDFRKKKVIPEKKP